MSTEIDPGSAGGWAAVRALLDAAERADGAAPVSDQAVAGAAQGHRRVLAFGADPETSPEAVGIVGAGELDLVVRPDARGRGVATAALAELLELPEASGELRAWVHGSNPAAEALLGAAGFAPVRSLHLMTLDPARLPQDSPDPAAPIRAAGFASPATDPADAAQLAERVRVNARAFADHPEQGAMTADDFALLAREPWFAADDVLLAADASLPGAPLAGFAWVKTVRGGGEVECELYVLGVDPAYAGRGLGRALLDATLARMAAHRPHRVSLYVDGTNERAIRLYERAGFALERESRQWLRRATPGDTAENSS
ncbi:mycothiol synthase [Leucobacter iarius]|uniref:Mycothiol synthase n=1 Tax=Leucobacter iarius TaxID=333963 RepID=A0ABN2LTV3_9MICO